VDRGEDAMTDEIKALIQEIEDILHYRLVWDPETKKFKKMLVYREDDLNRGPGHGKPD
jgi:hypothetical protein